MSHMTEHIGRVVGGRYRLLKPLGSGASAEVYLGDDVRLRRRVAVKILHTALADDEGFLRRFRAEARAAAALSHPNIVAIFDWNGDEVPPYLVTEFLPGGSLRAMLDAGHRLSPSQALLVGLQTAQALDHAHRQGFVHRDIKPANLLFGGDGRLRVADFGLARAIAEAGWTEPTGAVFGTARYASPEQARGEPLDGRSDVYSLALTMVEAVTGSVPFTADTTIGTLMARLDRPLEVPEELAALVPVIEAAGQVKPDDRPAADELATQLMDAATQLPRPERLPLVGIASVRPASPWNDDEGEVPGTSGPSADDPSDKTLVHGYPAAHGAAAAPTGPTAPTAPTGATVPVIVPAGPGGTAPAAGPNATTTAMAAIGATASTQALPDATQQFLRPTGPPHGPSGPQAPHGPHTGPPQPPDVLPPPSGPRRQWLFRALAALLAIAVGVGGAWFFWQVRRPSHVVPEALLGVDQGEINDHVGEFGWRIDVRREHREDTEAGTVIDTDPTPGSSLREGETLVVVVSRGAPPVDVPGDDSLRGLTREEAEGMLSGPGIELVPEFVDAPSEEVEDGLVIGVEEGTPAQLPRGSTVTVLVSSGPPGPTIPNVEGWDYDDARDALEDLGFDVDRENEPSDRYGQGQVTRTDPAIGEQAPEDSTVTVYVARGRGDDDDGGGDGGESVPVPDVSGMTIEEATEEIEDADLSVGDVTGAEGGVVRFVWPSPGSEVPTGSAVSLVLSPF